MPFDSTNEIRVAIIGGGISGLAPRIVDTFFLKNEARRPPWAMQDLVTISNGLRGNPIRLMHAVIKQVPSVTLLSLGNNGQVKCGIVKAWNAEMTFDTFAAPELQFTHPNRNYIWSL